MTRRLHIGGTVRKEGWEVLNAVPGDHVDHLGNALDLSQFEQDTFDCVYASHVLEHFDHARQVVPVLKEWLRVLHPDGRLLISVPDLSILSALFIEPGLSFAERHHVMRMIYGGHVDEYDFHQVGYDESILAHYLRNAGYQGCRRVPNHGIFNDTSEMQFRGRKISLNMEAYKRWGSTSSGSVPAEDELI